MSQHVPDYSKTDHPTSSSDISPGRLASLPQEILAVILENLLGTKHSALQQPESLAIMRTSRVLRRSALEHFTRLGLTISFKPPTSLTSSKAYSRSSWAPFLDVLWRIRIVCLKFEGFACDADVLRPHIEDLTEIWALRSALVHMGIFAPPKYDRSTRSSPRLLPNPTYLAALQPLFLASSPQRIHWQYDFVSPCETWSTTCALLAALEDGDSETIRTILASGTGANVLVDQHQGSPLRVAAWHGHTHVADLLIRQGADVNAESGTPETSILWAAVAGCNTETVRFLIQQGADVDASGGYDARVLERACYSHSTDIVRTLLEGLGGPNSLVKQLQKPVKIAAENGRSEVTRMLIAKGACVAGETYHIDTRHVECSRAVQLLRDAGASVTLIN